MVGVTQGSKSLEKHLHDTGPRKIAVVTCLHLFGYTNQTLANGVLATGV